VITCHTFDLEKIDEGTAEMLALLKAKPGEIRMWWEKVKK
jgi:hypothetical protein